MTKKLTNLLKFTALRLARTDILLWTLPLLMILLIIGTIAQKYIGLQTSLALYFGTFIAFIGPVPFPGGLTLITILFINMLMKFLMFSEWSLKKSGTILTHFGVLILIIGGGITAATEKDGYTLIKEGETTNIISDYHDRVLRVRENGKPVLEIPHQEIAEGQSIEIPNTKTSINIDQYCFHCSIQLRPETESAGWHKPANKMKLVDAKPLLSDEENLTGIEFEIRGADKSQNGKYLTFDKFPKPPTLSINNKSYQIEIGRAERALPFTVTLTKFTQNLHPGTMMAKDYASDIIVHDGDKEWNTRIEMNEPLRHKGYTLYQSSFDLSGDKPFTVLNVVENKGQFFPYLATIIMTLGLILHMVLRREAKPKGAQS